MVLKDYGISSELKASSHLDKSIASSSNVMVLSDETLLQDYLIKLQDDAPNIVLWNLLDRIDHSTPPFYITLELQNLHVHKCLYDSSASHSLNALVFMKKFGLDITRIYKELFSFDSKRVQCLGMIKYLVAGIVQIANKMLLWMWL